MFWENPNVSSDIYKYETFGRRLDYIMTLRNISNQTLARRLAVAVSTISGYRTGRRSPNVYDLARLSFVLNVSSDFLIGLSDQF